MIFALHLLNRTQRQIETHTRATQHEATHSVDSASNITLKAIIEYAKNNDSDSNDFLNKLIREFTDKWSVNLRSEKVANLSKYKLCINKNNQSPNFNNWKLNKLSEMKNFNLFDPNSSINAARQLLYSMCNRCTGSKHPEFSHHKINCMKFKDFAKICKSHGIDVSGFEDINSTADSIKFTHFGNDTIEFIEKMANGICGKNPITNEHYNDVLRLSSDIRECVAKSKDDSEIFESVKNILTGALTCDITVYENSNIMVEKNRKNPWEQYLLADIVFCDSITNNPLMFNSESDLKKYIGEHRRNI